MPRMSIAILASLPRTRFGVEFIGDGQEIREAPDALAGTALGGPLEPGINQSCPETARKGARSRTGPLPAAARGQPRDDIKPPLASLRPSSAWHNGQRRHAGAWGVWTPGIAESRLPHAFYISITTASHALGRMQGLAAIVAVFIGTINHRHQNHAYCSYTFRIMVRRTGV